MPSQTVLLHPSAPVKPRPGAPCNGCGLCCAAQPCPISLLFLPQPKKTAPCPALKWQENEARYICGLLNEPRHHLKRLPQWLEKPAIAFFYRRIAAGQGCDCDLELD